MSELHEALRRRERENPSAPLITWYGTAGERAELSVISFATAVAKTAGALLDEWEVPADATVRLELPLHWQFPVWLAACDLAGLVVVWGPGSADVDVVVTGDPATPAIAAFPVLTTTTAFGLPGPPVPAPFLDHARDAMGQPDVFGGEPGNGRWQVGDDVWQPRDIADRARDLGRRTGLGPGGRLLVTGPVAGPRTGLATWPAPLLAGAGAVLSQDEDPERVAAVEQITARAEPAGDDGTGAGAPGRPLEP